MAVTLSGKFDDALLARAKGLAQQWGLPFIERKRKAALGPLVGHVASALLVVGRDELVLTDAQGTLTFSPGMAHLRILRFDRGEEDDVMLRVSKLQPGESVLDCTLGLGADALVAARAVGPKGRVVGIEKSLALYALASEGLARHDSGSKSCRIQVQHGDAAEILARLESNTFDCVMWDPMFERPRRASSSFEVLRRHADYAPLTPEMLQHATRVARRMVLVKGARYSKDLKKLGLTPEPSPPHATVLWAKIEKR